MNFGWKQLFKRGSEGTNYTAVCFLFAKQTRSSSPGKLTLLWGREYQFDMGSERSDLRKPVCGWTVNSRHLCNLPNAYVLLRLACGNHSGSTATSQGQHAGRVVQNPILERTPQNRGNGSDRLGKAKLPSPPLKRLNVRDPSTVSF